MNKNENYSKITIFIVSMVLYHKSLYGNFFLIEVVIIEFN